MPILPSWLRRRTCAPTARRTRRLNVASLEDRVTPTVGDLLHTLTPPSGASLFASSMAASDQYVVVGAPGTTQAAGKAAIYDASSGARLWTLTNPSPANGDYFGKSVAVAGNLVVVGAPGDDQSGTDTGRAFVFNATTGSLVATLINQSPDPAQNPAEGFGDAVAITGDLVFVSADEDPHPALYSGNVYEYKASTGNYLGALTPPATAQSDAFGSAIAVSGTLLAVSAPTENPTAAGAVHIYDITTGNFLRTIVEPGPNQGALDQFGLAVGLWGTNLIVGAPTRDPGGVSDSGIAYAFNASTGALLQTFNNPSPASGDWFGHGVAVAGDTVIVGAPYDNTQASQNGQAYVFDIPSGTRLTTINNPVTSATNVFGWAAAAAGDKLVTGGEFSGTAYTFQGRTTPALPVANTDSFNVSVNSSANSLNVLSNDTSAVPASLVVSNVTQPAHGSVTIAVDNKSVNYTPTAGYTGADSFNYTITDSNGSAFGGVNITVNPAGPTANNDTFIASENSTANSINVLANDASAAPASLVVSSVTQPANGSVTISANGKSVTFTPNAGYAGPDSFTYTATDSNGNSTALVSLFVNAIAPTAVDDTATMTQNAGATAILVLANDIDPEAPAGLTITAAGPASHGTVVITGSGTGLTYAPTAGYAGPDQFNYTITDSHGLTDSATVMVDVTVPPPNQAPTAVVDTANLIEDAGALTIDVLANDSDPNAGDTLSVQSVTTPLHGTATVAADQLSVAYTPDPDFNGTDTFYYVINDGHGALASAPIVVTVANDAADRLEVVTTRGALDFREGRDLSLALDAGIQVGTAVGGLVTKAVLKFTNGYVKGRDTLAFVPQGGIKGKFSAGTGTLTLTGKASPAVYEAAVRTVQYVNRSHDPISGPRIVAITLSDAAGAGDPSYRQIHVTAVNDAPTLTLPPTAVVAALGKPAAVLSGVKIADADSAFLQKATITIINVQVGDTLQAATNGTNLVATFLNGVLTLTGSATQATYLKVLKSVKFVANSGIGVARTLSVTVDDGQLTSDPATRLMSVG